MIARIEFKKPPGADIEDVARFIRDALSSWGGGLHPDDPLFNSLELSTITVHGKTFDLREEIDA